MSRLTINTPTGASLKLDNPQNDKQAREQLMQKFKIAVNKLAALEDAEEQGRLVVLPTAEELDQRPCEFCDIPKEGQGMHLGPNGPYGCEGNRCPEAYERFRDEIEELTGVVFRAGDTIKQQEG